MLRAKKYGFTLVEVVIACSLFAIVVVGIILAINRSFAFMNNIKLSVRATNFAREGVEMMYNIRDTNWRRQSGDRDKYWLNLGDKANPNFIFLPGIYVLKEGKDQYDNSFLYAINLGIQDSNIEDFYSDDGFWKEGYSDNIKNAKIMFCDVDSEVNCKDGGETDKYKYYDRYSYYDENEISQKGNIQDVLIGDGIEFYRIVRVFGVYEKNKANNPGSSDEATSAQMIDGTPAEMRFCVKVFYRGNGEHSSELCSIMTNFME